MTAKELHEHLKAMVDWDKEFLMITNVEALTRSLGETRRNGGTLFSVTLNQGFGIPMQCCRRYSKWREPLPAAQRRLLESVPVVDLNINTNGLKAVAFIMGLLDKGVHLSASAIAHDRNYLRGHNRTLHDFCNYDRSDRLLVARFDRASHSFWEAHRNG